MTDTIAEDGRKQGNSPRITGDEEAQSGHAGATGAPDFAALPAHPSSDSDRRGYNPRMKKSPFSRLAVRLSVGVAALFAVFSIALVAMTRALWTSDRALEDCMRLTSAEREAASIAGAAREQYIHESHGMLTLDEVHVAHDHHWAAKLAERVARLRPLVGYREAHLLDKVQSNSTQMSRLFLDELFPAGRAGDLGRVRGGYNQVQTLTDEMVAASDQTIKYLAQKQTDETSFALRRARVASVTAAVTSVLAAIVAIVLAVAMIRGIVGPLRGLNVAAGRIGQGDFNAVAPPTGAAEFEELRAGLERMAAGLREREARLLKAERLAGLGALAAGVAHELNNPLGVILGFAKTLVRADVRAEVAADLRIIEEEAHQCRRIVEDLVAFAREPRIERMRVDVPSLVRDVAERLHKSGEIPDRAVRVSGVEHASAWIDSTRIAQVLRNLLLNAAAASNDGTAVEVEVAASRDDALMVKVSDHGSGISRDDLPHIFEPFFSRRPGGTGLGLAVSHGIVLAHGGSIDVQSVEGKGTVVTVTLPQNRTAVA
jgi:signal transduction histidine kinase